MKINIDKYKGRRLLLIIIAVVLIGATVAAIFIFRGDRNQQKIKCDLYFLNEARTGLVSEEREIKYHSDESMRANIVMQLIKGPEAAGNNRIIEKNTRLINILNEPDGNVVVNFSEEYKTSDNTKNALSTYAVVKSLCALDSVTHVKVTVEGENLNKDDGSEIGYLSSADINLPTDTYTSEMRSITLYFADSSGEHLQKETQNIKITDQQPVEQYIINALIKAPQDMNLKSTLNKDTTLISVDVYNDICFVNFKTDFVEKNAGSESKEKLAVYSVVNSLTELENIKRVQILIDGKKENGFSNVDISVPLKRDASIIE